MEKALKDGGLFLLHFISALKEHPGDPWIKKYIFPGGVVPSLREMISCMADDNFHVLDVENLRPHYNRTLLCWEHNFREHMEEAEQMFDEKFLRMWELYLSSARQPSIMESLISIRCWPLRVLTTSSRRSVDIERRISGSAPFATSCPFHRSSRGPCRCGPCCFGGKGPEGRQTGLIHLSGEDVE